MILYPFIRFKMWRGFSFPLKISVEGSIYSTKYIYIVWQAPDTQIDGSSIPRQRLGKWLVTLLCKSWLWIPTFPMPRVLLYFLSNEVVVTTIREELKSYESKDSRVSYLLASEEGRHQQTPRHTTSGGHNRL
jgi:hypothetical protein